MAYLVDGLYKKTPRFGEITLRISLRFTIEPMTTDRELQDLVREFEQRGLPDIFSQPPTLAPHEETPPALTQLMQT